MAETQVKTRVLIISDTHGMDFDVPEPDERADVVIHCGDLTDGSQLNEYRKTIAMLKRIDASLKLVIAGNHDFTLDIPAFERKVSEAVPALDSNLVAEFDGTRGDARRLFDEASDEAIVLLDEGSHNFTLQNGALLTVYASPYTPSLGAWGFQYHPEHGHDFAIQKGVDIVITHGPPRGIMDYTYGRERAGCPHLFAAVARARPRIHCFGHIHEGWGARLVAWKDEHRDRLEEEEDDDYCPSYMPTHFTAIDNTKSMLIEKLTNLKLSEFESEQGVSKHDQCKKYYATSHCTGDERPLIYGSETLFVNASIMGDGGEPTQNPWLVDIELPLADLAATESITTSVHTDVKPEANLASKLTKSNTREISGTKRKRKRGGDSRTAEASMRKKPESLDS